MASKPPGSAHLCQKKKKVARHVRKEREKVERGNKGEEEMGNARSTMTSIVSVIELSQSERRADKCEKKKGGGTVPFSSMSNDAGVSSSLIRVPSYKNLLS